MTGCSFNISINKNTALSTEPTSQKPQKRRRTMIDDSDSEYKIHSYYEMYDIPGASLRFVYGNMYVYGDMVVYIQCMTLEWL